MSDIINIDSSGLKGKRLEVLSEAIRAIVRVVDAIDHDAPVVSIGSIDQRIGRGGKGGAALVVSSEGSAEVKGGISATKAGNP